jgi:hypothetical protein
MKPFWVAIAHPIIEEKTPESKPVLLKEYQIRENHTHELNTYNNYNLYYLVVSYD